ncbi:hypothetical protein [uncultured Deinococcus sp.]|uniref:hypothetical protein n=1 Tax=uncultured Deinococcus sp. TaxID=158789 RepID=UPI0025F299CC|nr:hypothetical protein [uncultured Deinococcus sp.]
MIDNLLRYVVPSLAAVVSGALIVVLVTYARATVQLGRAPGALLLRHVVEVSAGTLGLVATAGAGVYDSIPGVDLAWPDLNTRLWLYLISMVLLLAAMVEVGNLQRQRGDTHHQQAQSRHGR